MNPSREWHFAWHSPQLPSRFCVCRLPRHNQKANVRNIETMIGMINETRKKNAKQNAADANEHQIEAQNYVVVLCVSLKVCLPPLHDRESRQTTTWNLNVWMLIEAERGGELKYLHFVRRSYFPSSLLLLFLKDSFIFSFTVKWCNKT